MSAIKKHCFKPNPRLLAQFVEEIYQNRGQMCQGVIRQILVVLRTCLVFLIASKRIELQTQDWSSSEDIFAENMKKSNF